MSAGPRELVIVGDGEFAEIAWEYFTYDSTFRVVAFAVERPFLSKDSFCGLPVMALDEITKQFRPAETSAYVAVTFTQLNRVRARLYHAIKTMGYHPASYVSSSAFVWHNAAIGEHCFVFENNVIQHHARVGDNVVLWSGNHVGHRSVIRDHAFLSSHVVVSGYADIGESCFVGVNSSIADRVRVARDCVIGAGTVIAKDTEEGKVYSGNREGPSKVGSHRLFKVREAA